MDLIVASSFVLGSLWLATPLLETKVLVETLRFGAFSLTPRSMKPTLGQLRKIDGCPHDRPSDALTAVLRLDEDSPQLGAVSEFR